MLFFFFGLLIWCISLIDFKIYKQPCITIILFTWSWCKIIFYNLLSNISYILLRKFKSFFMRDIHLQFSFYMGLSGLIYYSGLGSVHSLSGNTVQNWCQFFLKYLVNFSSKNI